MYLWILLVVIDVYNRDFRVYSTSICIIKNIITNENYINFGNKSGLKRLLYSNSGDVITLGEDTLLPPSPPPPPATSPIPTPIPLPNITVCE